MEPDEVRAIVVDMLASGEFLFPGGRTVESLIGDHDTFQTCLDEVEKNQRYMMTELFGPPKVNPSTGNVIFDGEGQPVRDSKQGRLGIPWGKLLLVLAGQTGAIVGGLALWLR